MSNADDGLIRAAERLEFSAELARIMIHGCPDAVVCVDGAGRIVFVNLQAELLFGYTRDELHSMTVEELLPEALREIHAQHRRGFMAEMRVRRMGIGLNLQARQRSGDRVAVDINLGPLTTTHGVLVMATIRRRT